MKIAKKLTIVSSLLLVAGCAHQERQARYDESSTIYGASSTTSSGISGTASATAQPSTSFEGTATTSATSQTDQTLVSQVQQAFRNDSTLAAIAPSIQVTAQNGMVTLSGKVSSEQEKQKAETMAKSASGVVSVNNQIQVPLQPTS